MKNNKTIGFIILMLGFLLISGCTSTEPTTTTTQPTVITTTEVIATTVIPTSFATTSTATTVIPTSLPITTTSVSSYSTNDINKHFVDVAFGPDYSYINKWNKQLIGVAITGAYNNDDVKTLNDFFKLFNSYSSYTKLASEVKQGDKGEIVMNFLPESSLKNINTDNSWKISINHETGSLNFIYKTTTNQFGGNTENIYINSDLKGNERKHWILRSLLYELGFSGETGTYPDSMFYSDSNTATTLSKIDLKALELMYGSKISFGMTLNQVRQLLLINTT